MPRKRIMQPWKIGYEADAWLARRQMTELIGALNEVVIPVATVKSAPYEVRLPLSDAKIELRRLVSDWFASGPNLRVLFDQQPQLEQRTKYGKTVFWSAPSGRGHLDWIPEPTGTKHSPSDDEALCDFMRLITNPDWHLLGGPCGRCGKYFLKTRGRKKYCSRSCGTRTTATLSVAKKREQIRKQQLISARRAISEWRATSRKQDWKIWVSHKTGFSANWLTRAVNQKNLRPPGSAPNWAPAS